MAEKIYVSPSSQTSNTYAIGNTNEETQCEKIAVALVAALKRCGFEAMTNLNGNMYIRVTESNKWGADLHVPIHTNACNAKVMGTRLMAYNTNGEGYKACKEIMTTLAPITPGTSDNITASPGLYEIKHADAPTAYIEVAFHDNETEARWIIDHTEDIAEAICKGICNHFKRAYVSPVKKPLNETESKTFYRVQVGAYSNRDNAVNMANELKAAGYDAIIVEVNK